MKNKSKPIVYLLSTLLTVLTGCSKIVDWGVATFNQGELLKLDTTIAQSHLRSITAYDQFTTIARFDVLWLSDAVRDAYVNLYARTTSKSDEQKEYIRQRQQDEGNHFIMFYVLSPYEIPLTSHEAQWHVFLTIDDVHVEPIEIKIVELSPIYRTYFGNCYNKFKAVYQVKFDAKDMNDNSLITTSTKAIGLSFRSMAKELSVQFDVRDGALVVDSNVDTDVASTVNGPHAITESTLTSSIDQNMVDDSISQETVDNAHAFERARMRKSPREQART